MISQAGLLMSPQALCFESINQKKMPLFSCVVLVLFPCIQAHPAAATTPNQVITGAAEIALLVVSRVPPRRGTSVALPVHFVVAPAFPTVLDANPLVVPAALETALDGHVVAVVVDLAREQPAGGGLDGAGVECEVAVAGVDDGRRGGDGC